MVTHQSARNHYDDWAQHAEKTTNETHYDIMCVISPAATCGVGTFAKALGKVDNAI